MAYPVMTLVFEIDPAVARNFSLAIQSVGMTAAALYIYARCILVEITDLWIVALAPHASESYIQAKTQEYAKYLASVLE